MDELIKSVVILSLPIHALVVKFFQTKELPVVKWIQESKDLKCVVEAVKDKSTIDIYSTDETHAQKLLEKIKGEFGSLLELEPSLTEEISPDLLAKFLEWLRQQKDVEFEIKKEKSYHITVCGFKLKLDEVYNKFLESLINN